MAPRRIGPPTSPTKMPGGQRRPFRWALEGRHGRFVWPIAPPLAAPRAKAWGRKHPSRQCPEAEAGPPPRPPPRAERGSPPGSPPPDTPARPPPPPPPAKNWRNPEKLKIQAPAPRAPPGKFSPCGIFPICLNVLEISRSSRPPAVKGLEFCTLLPEPSGARPESPGNFSNLLRKPCESCPLPAPPPIVHPRRSA